ncbi:MAG: zinc ribbon domain-containing protein [Candidatus Aminicenantes bacterium]|nr:zinc ribbon domain-containing protein [Candidatus Aminicenantes bacterium]
MNSSSAKTLGVVIVILAVLMAVGLLRLLILIPLGIVDGVGHGLRSSFFDRGGSWFWPWAGFAGFFGLIFLFFWVMVIIWVYRDAEKRGMGGALWAVIVFFTHVVGLIIYAIVRAGKPVKQYAPTPPPPPEAKPSAPAAPPVTAPIVVSPARPTACSRCGKEIRPEWLVCPFCGEKI